MTRPTPEREEHIRKNLHRFKIAKIEIRELLAEIDALRTEYKDDTEVLGDKINEVIERNIALEEELDVLRAEIKADPYVSKANYMEVVKERDDLRLAQKIDGIALDLLNAKNAELKSRIEKLRKALKRISKMWHDDCGCMVECKIACEALTADDEAMK